MYYSKMLERLNSHIDLERQRDQINGAWVIRAMGQWHSGAIGRSTINGPNNLPMMIQPFLTVLSSPHDNVVDRSHVLVVADGPLGISGGRDHMKHGDAELIKPYDILGLVSLKAEIFGPLTVSYVDGNVDTLTVGGEPTHPSVVCEIFERFS